MPQPSVDNRQGNPQILCQVLGSPASAHVLSWYQQLPGKGPTFLLSQREGAAPTYGPGVTPRFLAELDLEKNRVCLTVGNAGPEDVGIYYCALWYASQYIFGEGTWFLHQAERSSLVPHPPQLTLLTSGPASLILCVALGHQPAPLRLSWALESQLQNGGVEESLMEDMGDTVVSTLHLSNRTLAGTVICKPDHESGTSVATLRLPPSKKQAKCFWDAEAWNGGQENDQNILAQLEWTLTFALYCYLGMLGGAKLYALLLAVLLATRKCPALSAGSHTHRRSKGGPRFQTAST
ncbi:immunoglobulin alpha-2 heavy chain-like isoform X2 [Phascolarctos cinereus]|uniref:immunoglobulin kappa light chain-like isoform X2 n=1 Tax=Phascolarctos cinereus TaxID=38626 RepID=UPI000A28B812|nr:immunoglobulin kappa light chain-like isoform X2 [Phascolarctos cinereus]